jgi:hypothetical protein
VTTIQVFDAIHDNISHLPKGQAAGYSTGSGTGIRWTAADFAAHPGAVRIDQDAIASDPTADVLDVEEGAATLADCAPWVKRARACYAAASRPGQRRPAIYMSRSQVTPVVNALITGGIKSGVGLWVADWMHSKAEASGEVETTAGPFPVIGVQYDNAGPSDISMFSAQWLKEVSVASDPKPPVPPGDWADPAHWSWKEPFVGGIGQDGKFHLFTLVAGQWVKVT